VPHILPQQWYDATPALFDSQWESLARSFRTYERFIYVISNMIHGTVGPVVSIVCRLGHQFVLFHGVVIPPPSITFGVSTRHKCTLIIHVSRSLTNRRVPLISCCNRHSASLLKTLISSFLLWDVRTSCCGCLLLTAE